ncbi:serine/threonine-protein phosphatase 6 regulatory ankyrin repeat subunit C-like [Sitodiplosis mosellana]|uniref:serine/threonine-protein phosphatase 6 regulatory ankyrin repeat subunit C-like n=1 Tax=Sitodiplosis mosellana TaxID=263140 RepID=UPI002443C297|nr:serine/threonine-protein phosphatase 6 regulatory ankyrin repeat subunit C-like [Sitodiplosis mosellana]
MKFSVLIVISASWAFATSDPKDGCDLIKALETGNETEAIRLLEEGVNATYVNRHKRLPMHLAALYGYEKFFHSLMEKGYKYQIHEKDDFYAGIPLMSAIRNDLLLKSGSDVNTAETVVGWNPLRLAARSGDVKMIELLLNNGADVYSTNGFGVRALQLATLNGHLSAAYILEVAEINSAKKGKELPKNMCVFPIIIG